MNPLDDGTRTQVDASPKAAIPHRLARRLAWILTILAFVHPIATCLGEIEWWADLISHFRELALVLTLAATVAMAPIRRWVAVGLAVFALFQAGAFRPAGGLTRSRLIRDPRRS